MDLKRNETTVSIVTYGNKLILLKRKTRKDDPWSGDMCFPGGFIKDGEDIMTAALRELNEETSIDLKFIRKVREFEVFHPKRITEINVHPIWFSTSRIMSIHVGDEIERGGWYTIGDHIRGSDERRGEFLTWNGDIVWGLTYRIYLQFLKYFNDQ